MPERGNPFPCTHRKRCASSLCGGPRGKPVVLAFTNHDHRDIRPDVNAVRAMLSSVSAEFPDVPFRFSEAVDAMRSALQLPFAPACDLDVRLASVEGGGHVLEVRTETPTFGPQPWLGIKTRTGVTTTTTLISRSPIMSGAMSSMGTRSPWRPWRWWA